VILTVFLLVSYLFGSVPSGILLARAAGLGDPRDAGSGNIGASNLTRLGGKKLGALTFLLDFLKGFVPVFFAYFYWPDDTFPAALGALLAVTGHCYSIFLFFQGGKGVATTAGALFPLAPFAMIVALAAWGLSFYAYRMTSLAAMVALFALLGSLLLFGAPAHLLGVAGICCVMVVRRHQANLEDLLGGKERSF
jgi:acyl phosphate:glycerol-3-phosphate acyltransferase